MSLIYKLCKQELVRPPDCVKNQTQYEVYMGSVAYGTNNLGSDIDLYGFCIPDKNVIFPHLDGEILGFGKQKKRFGQYQEHHIKSKDGKKEYDITIYSIVKYFQLCMDNNPNMIDSMFIPNECVVSCTPIGDMVRSKRDIFLHKGCFHKLKGYSYSQIHKMKIKTPDKNSKRMELIERYGYDTKYAMHTVRLLLQCEQILTEHTLDLRRNREHLKAIRRGEVKEEEIYKFFDLKERDLEKLYNKSKLRYGPDEKSIKQLLINCLEQHYGSLENCVSIPDKYELIVQKIRRILDENENLVR